jgi:hypothetical protein
LAELQTKIQLLQERGTRLQEEYDRLPTVDDLREENRMMMKAYRIVEQMREEGMQLDEQLRTVADALKEQKKEALQIADRLYLSGNLGAFQTASDASRGYEKHLVQLQSGHEVYLQRILRLQELQERMEQLDDDMEQIRYDMGRVKRALGSDREEYRSVTEQLKLTDYEKIRDRIDACVKWLNDYPAELRRCAGEKARRQEQMDTLRKQCESVAGQIAEEQKKGEHFRNCYEAEKKLDYVVFPEEFPVDAKSVRDYLAPESRELAKETLIGNLNQVYFENRGFLNDYQPMQNDLLLPGDEGDPRLPEMV